MAVRNLLDIVNTVLEPLNESYVDTLDETDRSLQVARLVKEVYYTGMANRNWPHKTKPVTMQPYGVDTPTHLIIPSDVKEIQEIKYDTARVTDTRKKYSKLDYMTPVDFIDYTNSRNSSKSDVTVVTDPSGIELLIKNDKPPQYWTSLDQERVVFDSYDSAVDSTIRRSKQQVYVVKSTEFLLEDDYILDLPEEAFPWLIAEAKAWASVEIKQEINPKAEQISRQQNQQMSRKSRKAGEGKRLPSYGRVSKK